MPKTETQSVAKNVQRKPLRVQPLAADAFTTFVYVCIGMLLFGEIIALFWLDLL